MEFLANVFTNFIFEKLLSRIKSNAALQGAINEINCLSDVRRCDSFRSKFFYRNISCFLSFWVICSRHFMVSTYSSRNSHLLGINNAKWYPLTLRNLLFAGNQEQVILSYQTQWHSRERMQEQNHKCKLALSLLKKREKTRLKRSLNKNVIVISVIAQRCEIFCIVLGRCTSKLHTPPKLTNGI